jgi:hypothetical protein
LWAILRAQVVWRHVTGPAWVWVAAALALALAPVIAPDPLSGVPLSDLVILGGAELLLGTLVGLVLALPGHGLLGALAVSGRSMGLQQLRSRTLVLAVAAVVLTVALGTDLHQVLLVSLRQTLDTFAVGRPHQWLARAGEGLTWLGPAVHGAAVLALALATPALLASALVETAVRVLGSGPGTEWVVPVAPWARTALGLVALGGALAAYPEAWTRALG